MKTQCQSLCDLPTHFWYGADPPGPRRLRFSSFNQLVKEQRPERHPSSALAGFKDNKVSSGKAGGEPGEDQRLDAPRGLRSTQCRAGKLNKQYPTGRVNNSVKKTYDSKYESS